MKGEDYIMTLEEYLDSFEGDIDEYVHHVTEFNNRSISAKEFIEREIDFRMKWAAMKNVLISKYGEE